MMHVECARARLALPVGALMSSRPVPVLQRLARGWPFDWLPAGGAHSMQAVAVFEQSLASPEFGFCDSSDTQEAISDLFGAV